MRSQPSLDLARNLRTRLALACTGLYGTGMDRDQTKADPLIGRDLDNGRYRLTKRLGAGGMGSVYVAHQATVDRNVAVKVIHPQLLVDPSLKLRFNREARVLASLDSSHCVTIHDYGETDDGLLYIVMELLDGLNLSQMLKQERQLTPSAFLNIFGQVCRGVGAAHQAGLVHRDLKPENIFVETNHEPARVKVLDFGLAKIISGGEQPTQGLTVPGMVFGTPQYTSPEQAYGEKVDHRTDIYALGLIAYECLSGKPAFRAKSARAMLVAQVSQPPPDMTDLEPDVPPAVGQIILKALSKQRTERPESVMTFMHELERAFRLPGTATDMATAGTLVKTSPPVPTDSETQQDDQSNAGSAPKSIDPAVLASQQAELSQAHNHSIWVVLLLAILISGLAYRLIDRGAPAAESPKKLAQRCDMKKKPPYDSDGKPCQDGVTQALFNFDEVNNTSASPHERAFAKLDATRFASGVGPGKALIFDNKQDSPVSLDRSVATSNVFTLEFWVKPNPTTRRCHQFLVTFGIPGSGTRHLTCTKQPLVGGWTLSLLPTDDTGIHFNVILTFARALKNPIEGPAPRFGKSHSKTPPRVIRSETLLRAGAGFVASREWNHVALTSDGDQIVFFVNGEKQIWRDNLNPYRAGEAGFSLGGFSHHTAGRFEGLLDEIRVSTTVRPENSIRTAFRDMKSTILRVNAPTRSP